MTSRNLGGLETRTPGPTRILLLTGTTLAIEGSRGSQGWVRLTVEEVLDEMWVAVTIGWGVHMFLVWDTGPGDGGLVKVKFVDIGGG